MIPPTWLAVLSADGETPAEAIVVRFAVPTRVPQPPGGNPEEDVRHVLADAAWATGYRETGTAFADFFDFPTGNLVLRLEEVTLAPGAAVPTGGRESLELSSITRGTVTLALTEGVTEQVTPEGIAPAGPPNVAALAAGDTAALAPGGFYALPPDTVGEVRNAGDEPATLLRVVVAPVDASATPVA